MPSIPIFTMPDRSFMTPQSAPKAIGVARPSTIGAMFGHDLDHVPDELEEDAEDRDPVHDLHQAAVTLP